MVREGKNALTPVNRASPMFTKSSELPSQCVRSLRRDSDSSLPDRSPPGMVPPKISFTGSVTGSRIRGMNALLPRREVRGHFVQSNSSTVGFMSCRHFDQGNRHTDGRHANVWRALTQPNRMQSLQLGTRPQMARFNTSAGRANRYGRDRHCAREAGSTVWWGSTLAMPSGPHTERRYHVDPCLESRNTDQECPPKPPERRTRPRCDSSCAHRARC
jgi:hypothetical protein